MFVCRVPAFIASRAGIYTEGLALDALQTSGPLYSPHIQLILTSDRTQYVYWAAEERTEHRHG